ncbi:5'-deoxynucleotidase HDDC2 isoform X2 [Macaca fascicularis]|uniref:5'-deoxynucleotidase HDDC2 isoform X2 n=1 Tax=Macaca fascicularis TaxID=9541 RepID=UPI0032B03D82
MASVSSATFLGHGARSLLQFLRLVGQLKRVPRTGWVYRNVQRPESVSDHMYRMAVMAMVIKDDRLNKDRCVRLALVHDMAECIVGDIAPADNIPKEEKHRREEEAMKQITQLLPEDLRKELYELWEVCWSLLRVHSRPSLPGYHQQRLQNSKDCCLFLPLEASSQRGTP